MEKIIKEIKKLLKSASAEEKARVEQELQKILDSLKGGPVAQDSGGDTPPPPPPHK